MAVAIWTPGKKTGSHNTNGKNQNDGKNYNLRLSLAIYLNHL